MKKRPKSNDKPYKLKVGDDPVESFESDLLDFKNPAIELAKDLYEISKTSGVCCGVVGSWGSGKSSFMKLMDEHVRKEYTGKKGYTAWFTAWDPGGAHDLGDAMLHSLFRELAEGNKELSNPFKELENALGMRRSAKQTVGRILQNVSGALPEGGRVAAKATGSLLCELDTSRTIRESFVSLMEWLRKEDCTVFYFIDDIDRASGDQIRDLLSELKLYVSHSGIIAILGYDTDYVVNALRVPGILPQGTDPEKYLEKIVTIRRNVPTASFVKMREYAALLTQTMTNLIKDSGVIAYLAALLSSGNPRQLKRLILRFTNLIDSEFRETD